MHDTRPSCRLCGRSRLQQADDSGEGSVTRQEEGFTLIELLVSITITLVILTAITSALIVTYKNAAYTTRRDDHSAGAQLLSAYLDRDFASGTACMTPGTVSGCT